MYPEPTGAPIVVVTTDPLVQSRCEEVARGRSAVLLPLKEPALVRGMPPPGAYVFDLSLEGALAEMPEVKKRHGDVPLAAVVSFPDQAVWRQAEAAGADIVLTRGTIHRQLPAFLDAYATRAPGRRIRIGPLNDFEGRLGFLWLIEEGTEGAPEDIAVFRVGYAFHAVSNRCPHAGVPLHQGELVGQTLTCPGHGSQFDVTTGERTRGPSDEPIVHYPVEVEGGSVFVVLD